MVGTILILLAAVASGFGLGRIKNSAKLSNISAELNAAEAKASVEVKSLIARVRGLL